MRSQAESGQARRIALIGPTAADTRDVIIEGESGILAICPPWNRPKYEPSKRRLTWPNGAIATAYSADEPERLRGPQHDAAWADEVGAWRYPAAWDMLMFGLRLGTSPRVAVTTTPRPTKLLKKIIESKTTAKTGGSTYDNRPHLARIFFDQIITKYEGTRLGRQELLAELLEVLDGVWFHNFDPGRNVSILAEYDPALPVRVAIDAGTSRHTGAVFYQTRELTQYRHRVTVFGDYYAVDLYSEQNAIAILAEVKKLAKSPYFLDGRIDKVRLDPAASAKTGVGPAARAEYERVFGDQITGYWPMHRVLDGLDQLELLVGSELREPDLLIHPRCEHLIGAFNGYVRASSRGEFLTYPLDPQHPHEELIDSLRGGVRDAFPWGRQLEVEWNQVPVSDVL